MRIERAIDAFLDWRRLERDATPRSVDSYRRILWKLAEAHPEGRLEELTTSDLRAFLAEHWRERSASTRSNVISVLHSFFAWAEAEDLVEHDPSRKIRRQTRSTIGPCRQTSNSNAASSRLVKKRCSNCASVLSPAEAPASRRMWRTTASSCPWPMGSASENCPSNVSVYVGGGWVQIFEAFT